MEETRKKLIIHETDCHGCGKLYYKGQEDTYSYDDSYWGDLKTTVENLIKIGFIKAEDVEIFTDSRSIYEELDKHL